MSFRCSRAQAVALLDFAGTVAYIRPLRKPRTESFIDGLRRTCQEIDAVSSTYYPTRLNVDPSALIAPGAVLVGDVTVGRDSSVWFQATLRGDLEPIEIGEETNIQDGCVVHVDVGYPTRIGARVTLGHGAIVHGATIADDVLIAMRAVVLNGCRVGRGSLIGAGAVLPEGLEVLEGSLVLGVPARIVRGVKPQELERIRENARSYVALSRAYREGRIRIEVKGR